MSEVLNFNFVLNQNEEVFNVKLERTNVGLTTSYKIKLLVLYIYIYIYEYEVVRFCAVFLSYNRTLYCTMQYNSLPLVVVVCNYCILQAVLFGLGAVIQFDEHS